MRPHNNHFNAGISNHNTLVKAKAKSSEEIAMLTAEYLDNGGDIDVIPCPLDNGYDIKARMGENGGLI